MLWTLIVIAWLAVQFPMALALGHLFNCAGKRQRRQQRAAVTPYPKPQDVGIARAA